MLNEKINKPILTQEDCDKYSALAKWCNNNQAHLEERDEYYIVVKNAPYVPTTQEQISALKNELEKA